MGIHLASNTVLGIYSVSEKLLLTRDKDLETKDAHLVSPSHGGQKWVIMTLMLSHFHCCWGTYCTFQ